MYVCILRVYVVCAGEIFETKREGFYIAHFSSVIRGDAFIFVAKNAAVLDLASKLPTIWRRQLDLLFVVDARTLNIGSFLKKIEDWKYFSIFRIENLSQIKFHFIF